jgi:AAHS family 4-hydroxybenzoate transporter-like MFS transporter
MPDIQPSAQQHAGAIPHGRFRRLNLAIALCVATATVDGMDTANMGVAMPFMARAWGLPQSAFGVVLGVTLFGVAIGSLIFGLLGDRIGRRPIIVGMTWLVAAISLATIFTTSLTEVFLCRLMLGICLGATSPNVHALTAEFAPARRRSVSMTLIVCGVSLGGLVGSAVAPLVLNWAGWKGIFIFSGAVTIIMASIVTIWLPESPTVSARLAAGRQGAPHKGVAVGFLLGESRQLFAGQKLMMTLSYWLLWSSITFTTHLLVNWLPSILLQTGLSTARAMADTSLLYAGGIFGGVCLGWLMDGAARRWIITGTLSVGAVLFGAFLVLPAQALPWGAMVFLIGATMMGANNIMQPIGAMLYPPVVLATGIGWGSAVARFLGAFSPVVGGWAAAAGWHPKSMIAALIVPTLICIAAVLFLFGRLQRTHWQNLTPVQPGDA